MMKHHGGAAFADLQRRAADAQHRSAETGLAIGRLRERASELVARRGGRLTELAEHLLPDVSEVSVAGTFVEVREDLRQIIARRAQRLEELRASITAASAELERLDRALTATTARQEARRADEAALEARLKTTLEADAEFVRLSNAAARAEQQLSQNEARVAEIDREAAEKLPAYERSALFQYLWRREFETPRYSSRGLIRRLDRWVAGLIGYRSARQSYDFLRVTPKLVLQELERRRAEFDDLMEQVEARHTAAAAALGLPAVEADVAKLETECDGLEDGVAAARHQLQSLSDEVTSIEHNRGRFYAEAIARFRSFLGEAEHARLEREARNTPQTTDDAIVAEVGAINRDLDGIERELEQIERDHADQERRARGLEDLLSRFKSAGFHGARSRFDDDPAGHFDRLERGQTSADEVWRDLQRSHRREVPRSLRDDDDRGGGGPFEGIGAVLRHPATRVLAEVMGHVVAGALTGSARRSVGRRGGFGPFGGGGGRSGGFGGFGGGGGGGGRSGGGGFSIGDRF